MPYFSGVTGVGALTIRFFHCRLAKVQGALDAIEAAKTGVEKHTRMAEKSAVQVFASIRADVDSREKAVLEVSTLCMYGVMFLKGVQPRQCTDNNILNIGCVCTLDGLSIAPNA